MPGPDNFCMPLCEQRHITAFYFTLQMWKDTCLVPHSSTLAVKEMVSVV